MKRPASILDNLTAEEMSAVVQRIIYLRTKREFMTQVEFSKRLNISQSYISQLEAGRKPLTKSAYEKIISVFRLKPEWLLHGRIEDNDDIYSSDSKDVSDNNEWFLDWYQSLPSEEQLMISRSIKGLYDVMKSYPPES